MDCPVCSAPLDGSPKFCARCGSSTVAPSKPGTVAAPATEVEPRVDPFIGTKVAGRYQITKLLGEGGMGAVYIGEQNIGGTVRKVAIKTLHAHLSKDPKILQRFERECATVAELQHPNTIQLYDFGKTDDGILYMVMEFVQGMSLAALLQKNGSLEPPRAQHILGQICDALGEAHALGIVHRDLKPENIVLTERAKDWVKVLDFGIAKRTEVNDKEEQRLTQQGTVLGTPPYMSPEQFTGRAIDARSDIYSIGVIAYEMLAGKLPFNALTPWDWATQHMTVMPKVLSVTPSGAPIPEPMVNAIMRALAKDPAERFATTREFMEALTVFFGTAELGTSGGYGIAPASMVAGMVGSSPVLPRSSASHTPAPYPSGAVAALGMPGPSTDSRGKTQIGDPTSASPSGAPAAPVAMASYPPVSAASPYGLPPGALATGPVPQFSQAAQNPYGAQPAPARAGRRGGGALIAFLAIGGILAIGAVGYALTSHRTSKHSGATDPSNANNDPTATVDAGNGQAPSNERPPRDRIPPLIDTALPSLPVAVDPNRLPPPSNVVPGPPASEPHACKSARIWQQRIAQSPSPGAHMQKSFNNEKAKCIAEGGHL